MSDTPLSKLLKQGSSMTSYTIGEVAKLEAQIAALTAELARVKAELAKWQRLFDQERLDAVKQQASRQDSLAAMQVYIIALEHGVKAMKAERDAALKDQARYRGLRAIIAAQRFVPVEQVDEEADKAIAAREG